MRLLHALGRTRVSFDDPNLVSRAGLVPVMALAQRAGLTELVTEQVRPGGPCGVNAPAKIGCLIAGMLAGADSIEDMDLLRHGAMDVLFGGVRAPSTLGSHLRSYCWGNVRQLDAVNRRLLAELARRAPLLPGKDQLAFVDIDSMQKRVYGHKKQGARFGHTKIQGKSLLVRPRRRQLRRRSHHHGTGRRVHRHDRGPDGLGVLRGQGDRRDPQRRRAVLRDGADGSQGQGRDHSDSRGRLDGHQYPRAIWDDQLRAWVSDAEVAEAEYTAFASKKGQAVTARLIIRRVRDLNKRAAAGQGELFPAWRYHALFTDSPFELIQAEGQHRDHAIVEQVFADVTDGPLAHLPSGSFPANAAWLTCAAIAHNLLRAAGALASLTHAKARGATLRRDLINVAARTARSGRGHIMLHLPEGWHREHEWITLFRAACGPPGPAA